MNEREGGRERKGEREREVGSIPARCLLGTNSAQDL